MASLIIRCTVSINHCLFIRTSPKLSWLILNHPCSASCSCPALSCCSTALLGGIHRGPARSLNRWIAAASVNGKREMGKWTTDLCVCAVSRGEASAGVTRSMVVVKRRHCSFEGGWKGFRCSASECKQGSERCAGVLTFEKTSVPLNSPQQLELFPLLFQDHVSVTRRVVKLELLNTGNVERIPVGVSPRCISSFSLLGGLSSGGGECGLTHALKGSLAC